MRYQKRSDDRCEGLYIAKVGSQTLEMVSFVWGSVLYSLKSQEKVNISVPGISTPVHVRAVAIPPGTYYRMDAFLPPGASLSWPVDDVLLPEGLNADRVGVFSWTDDSGPEVFIPVRAGDAADVTEAVLTVRASFDVREVQWRIAQRVKGDCGAFGAWQRIPDSNVAGGQSLSFGLGSTRGPHCIEVSAKGESGWTRTPLKIQMEIPEP